MRANPETRHFAAEQTQRKLGRLAFEINRTLKSRDTDAIHDLRVAIRRFTQSLRAFEPWFRGKQIRKMRRQLKRIMAPAGDVRNHDLALQILSRSHPDAANLISSLRAQRKESETLLVTLLRRWMTRKTSSKWRAALEAPRTVPRGSSPAVVGHVAQQMLPRMTKDFLACGNKASQAGTSTEKLHRFRIAAKKFRYTLELFATLYTPRLTELLGAIRRVQTLLGEINDGAMVREILSHYHGTKKLTNLLKKRQSSKIDEFGRYWQEAFGDREQMRAWIDYLRTGEGESRALKKPATRTPSSRAPNRRRPAVA